jgi:hypothetical protein
MDEQKQWRFTSCQDFNPDLSRESQASWLHCNSRWVMGISIWRRNETSEHAVDLKVITKTQKFRLQEFMIKTTLITLFDKQGVIQKEFVPVSQKVNSVFYVLVPFRFFFTNHQSTLHRLRYWLRSKEKCICILAYPMCVYIYIYILWGGTR